MSPPILFHDAPATRMEVEFKPEQNRCLVVISEVLDERVDFKQVLAAIQKVLPGASGKEDGDGGAICFDFGNCSRINSQGGRNWLFFLQGLGSFYRIEFACLTETLLELACLWPGVLGQPPVRVEEIAVPYICKDCSHELSKRLRRSQIRFNGRIAVYPKEICAKCGKAMMADVPDDYLEVLAP